MEIGIGSTTDQEIAHNADGPSDARPRGASEKFITFDIGEASYAIVASSVLEVARQLPVTPVPNSPRHLVGIAPLRDEVSAVVNVRGLLDETGTNDAGAKSRYVVMKRFSGDAAPVAFLVDRLGEIAQIELTAICAEPDGNEMMIGSAPDGSRRLKIIDHRKVAAADYFD